MEEAVQAVGGEGKRGKRKIAPLRFHETIDHRECCRGSGAVKRSTSFISKPQRGGGGGRGESSKQEERGEEGNHLTWSLQEIAPWVKTRSL